LLSLEGFIIDSAKVVVLEGNMLEFRAKDIHFTPIFEDDLIV
jgi:hypothetical protein